MPEKQIIMRTKYPKRITSLSLNDEAVKKLYQLNSKTLISKTKIVETLLNNIEYPQFKKLMDKIGGKI